MTGKGIRAAAVVLCLFIAVSLVCFYARAKQNEHNAADAVAYGVVQDDMGTKLQISVPADIDEKQLRATLRKAADDHQYDAARDLLFTNYLWVEAYLTNGHTQSAVAAGRLRRYVPAKNAKSGYWGDLFSQITGSRKDQFSTSLSQARQSLP